jgi:hypothetical protein
MDLNLLSITINILAPTNDISFMTTSCNCSYRHVSLFNEFDDKFGKLDNDYWIGMFNVQCIIKSLKLKTTLSCPHMASYMMASYGHAHHAF